MGTLFLMNRLLVDYRVLQYRCRHLASSIQLDIAEGFPGSISALSNAVYLGVFVWGRSFSQSLEDARKVSHLMTGQIPICLEVWPLQFPHQKPTELITVLAELPEPSRIWHCFVQPFPPTPVRNLTPGWCFHNRQSQICFDFALYHHCAEQRAYQFLLCREKHVDCSQAASPERSKEVKPPNRTGQEL